MDRRAETSAETRQRIVEATAALHSERGVSATSLRDIARRAGVSVGTAYHHFPSYDDAIRACGHYSQQIHPLPEATIFDADESQAARVASFVRAIGAFYEGCPWLELLRAERSRFAPLDEGLKGLELGLERLAELALGGPHAGRRQSRAAALSALIAFTDISVFRILRDRGLSLDQASTLITEAAVGSLPSPTRRRDPRAVRPSTTGRRTS